MIKFRALSWFAGLRPILGMWDLGLRGECPSRGDFSKEFQPLFALVLEKTKLKALRLRKQVRPETELEVCAGRIFQARLSPHSCILGPALLEVKKKISVQSWLVPKEKLKFRSEPNPARPIFFRFLPGPFGFK